MSYGVTSSDGWIDSFCITPGLVIRTIGVVATGGSTGFGFIGCGIITATTFLESAVHCTSGPPPPNPPPPPPPARYHTALIGVLVSCVDLPVATSMTARCVALGELAT